MQIRGKEVLLPCSMIGGYPRPHWLQGRVFGSLHEPLYRSMDLRIAYEKAVNRMLEGLDDLISIWHICYGSVDAQTDVWEDKAAEMMPMFETANVTAIHFESAHRASERWNRIVDFLGTRYSGWASLM